MAIARRRTNKKNNIRRKSRAVVKRVGARKMTQKGGSAAGAAAAGDGGGAMNTSSGDSAAAGGCVFNGKPLGTVKVEMITEEEKVGGNAGMDVTEQVRKQITVCVDPKILSSGFTDTELGEDRRAETIVSKFVNLVYKDSKDSLFSTLETAKQAVAFDAEKGLVELAGLPDIDGDALQNKYLKHIDGTPDSFVLVDRKGIPMTRYHLKNAFLLYRGNIELITASDGVVKYLPADFQADMQDYLRSQAGEITLDKVRDTLSVYVRKSANVIMSSAAGTVSTFVHAAMEKAEELYRISGTPEGQKELAKIVLTAGGLVYGGTLGTALSAGFGLTSGVVKVGLSCLSTVGGLGIKALLAGVNLGVSSYGLLIYIMFGMPSTSHYTLMALIYYLRKTYPALANPEELKKHLLAVLRITGVRGEFRDFQNKLVDPVIFGHISTAFINARNFAGFLNDVSTDAVTPLVGAFNSVHSGIKRVRAGITDNNLEDYQVKLQRELPSLGTGRVEEEEVNIFKDLLDGFLDNDPEYKPPPGALGGDRKLGALTRGSPHKRRRTSGLGSSGGARKLIKVRSTRKNSRGKSNKNKKNTKRRRARK